MPFIPALNTARVEMHFTQEAQKVMNVYHVKNTGAWTEPDLVALATEFATWWIANHAGHVSPTVILQKVIARDLTTEAGLAVEHTSGLPAPGTDVAAVPLPNHCTIAVKWTTGLAGRSYRGRTYHIGLDGAALNADKNTVGSGAITYLHGAYGALQVAIDGLGYQLAVASFYHGVDPVTHKPIPRAAAVVTGIIDVGVEPTVDSQRRRLPGRGQ